VRGELDLLRDVRTVGWYGTSEADTSLCTQAPEDFRAVHALPGGHHFNGNTHKHEPYLRIAAELRAEIDAALAGQ
jgi:type IV secretory pathway VirJ component